MGLGPWTSITEAEYAEMEAEIERLKIALVDVKMLVIGDAKPRWDNSDETTATRGKIADLCDRVLGM